MSTKAQESTQLQTAPNQNLKDYWAEVEHEILNALARSEIHKPSIKRLQVQVGATGIVLGGEVLFEWEREMAEHVARAHGHCMRIRNRILIWGESRVSQA